MNMNYLIFYQAEHTPDQTIQREIDRQNGELAAAFTGWLHRLVRRPGAATYVSPDCRYASGRTL